MQINYKLLKRINAKGKLDIIIASCTLAYWLYWMFVEIAPQGRDIIYISAFSGLVLGTSIGHYIRACYLKILLKQEMEEAVRSVRLMQEMRNTLETVSGSATREVKGKPDAK